MLHVLKDSQDMKIIRRNGWHVSKGFLLKRSGLSLEKQVCMAMCRAHTQAPACKHFHMLQVRAHCCLLGYDVMWSGTGSATFRGELISPCSRSRSINLAINRHMVASALRMEVLPNVSKIIPDHTSSHQRERERRSVRICGRFSDREGDQLVFN
jgi:hypothetical protein